MPRRKPNGPPRTSNLPLERRHVRREMQLDRRASDLDLIERLTLGLRRSQISATKDAGLPRSKKR